LVGSGDMSEGDLESDEKEEDTKMFSLKLTSNAEDWLVGEILLGTAHTINQAVAIDTQNSVTKLHKE